MRGMATVVVLFATLSLVYGQDIAFMDGALSNQQKADLYYNQMAYGKALKYYQKALDKSPDSESLKLRMAKCHVRLNDLQGARSYYETAITSSEATADDILNYAEALSASGEYEKAAQWYDQYRIKNPDDDRAALKKQAVENIKTFYEDSVAYSLQPAKFNSEKSDFSPTYWNNQTVFVSNRSQKKMFRLTDESTHGGFLDIYRWDNGQVFPFDALNKGLNEGPVAFFENGNKLIVTMNGRESSSLKESAAVSGLRLEIYALKDGAWHHDSSFPYNNAAYSVGHPSFDERNQVIYFASNWPGGKGGADIYKCEYRNGNWSEPENLESINTKGDELFPFIAEGGDLYFASNGRGGLGGLDLFKTKVVDAKRSVYNLGYPVNTADDDFGLVLDASGRQGFISSNRPNGKGSDDIYELTIFKIKVEIKVTDQLHQQPAKTDKVKIVDETTGREVDYAISGEKIVFDAIKDRHYHITVESEKYKIQKMDFVAQSDQNFVALDIPVVPMAPANDEIKAPTKPTVPAWIIRLGNLSKTAVYQIGADQSLMEVDPARAGSDGSLLEINDLYFRFDSDEITLGNEELKKIADLLIQFQSINLQIVAYCDAFGSVEYNDELSKKRIRKVVAYLQQRGISETRIDTVIVGKRKLFNNCYPSECSKEENQRNRRVEFFLVPVSKN